MKLNHDCVRECLLWIESNVNFADDESPQNLIKDLSESKDFTNDEILYSLEKLKEASYITGGISVSHGIGGNNIVQINSIEEITWEGHKYLDNIRDPKIWSDTKKATKSFTSVSLSMMGNIASQVIASVVKQSLNLP
ncbi:DUF2513 domain-containing protein [Nicoliella lavandulae]|uniref:DUF2513 domain-containing protein n=1 Tax=Nicoliella lavandulae TaxID=3082954 RepID=A0ABU8SMB0_9LACO